MSLLTRLDGGTAWTMRSKILATVLALMVVGTFIYLTTDKAVHIKDVQKHSLQELQSNLSNKLAKSDNKPIKSAVKTPVKVVKTPAPVPAPAPTPAPTVAPQPVEQPVQRVVEASPAAPTGCGDNQYAAYIYGMESGGRIPGNCNPTAQNAGGCLGIAQACPGSKLLAVCPNLDYACENIFFANYALARYGSWAGAYAFWLAHNYW